jgi:hypothetical protein
MLYWYTRDSSGCSPLEDYLLECHTTLETDFVFAFLEP